MYKITLITFTLFLYLQISETTASSEKPINTDSIFDNIYNIMDCVLINLAKDATAREQNLLTFAIGIYLLEIAYWSQA